MLQNPLQMIQHELPCRDAQKEAALHAWPATLPHLCPDSVLDEVALSICCLMNHIWHRSLGERPVHEASPQGA